VNTGEEQVDLTSSNSFVVVPRSRNAAAAVAAATVLLKTIPRHNGPVGRKQKSGLHQPKYFSATNQQKNGSLQKRLSR
jgi:hypothetical protein